MINIAILGAGAIARTHAEAFSDHPEYCKIVAVCNRHTDKAEKVIAEKGLDAKAYESLDAAMADVRIDAVSICLPPAVHAETAIMAAEKGRNDRSGGTEQCAALERVSAALHDESRPGTQAYK